jgi:Na+-transporting NADH:ubiquinone oxidoreductase subunit NqrC
MRFQIDIACDNAAFTNDDGDYDYANPSEEIARILHHVAGRVADNGLMGMLDATIVVRDVNGNAVGGWKYYDAPKGPGNGADGMSCPQWDDAKNDRCAGLLYAAGDAPPAYKEGSVVWACHDCDYSIIRIP